MRTADPSTHTWQPVSGKRSSSQIVTQVMDRFFDGLRPGEWLGTEGQLAERFGVSRVTVRDAVRELEARGVVDVRVGKRGGLRIAEQAPEHLGDALAVQLHLMDVSWDEVLEAQQALEPHSARLAAQRATAEDVAMLREVVALSRAAIGDPQRFTELALEFHQTIADAARSRVLGSTLAALQRVQVAQHAPQTSKARARRVVDAHEGILQAIVDGDADLASARMVEHLLVVHRKGRAEAAHGCGLALAS